MLMKENNSTPNFQAEFVKNDHNLRRSPNVISGWPDEVDRPNLQLIRHHPHPELECYQTLQGNLHSSLDALDNITHWVSKGTSRSDGARDILHKGLQASPCKSLLNLSSREQQSRKSVWSSSLSVSQSAVRPAASCAFVRFKGKLSRLYTSIYVNDRS